MIPMAETAGEALFPVAYFDGDRTTDMGRVPINAAMNFKGFQSIISKKIGVSPHQITIYFERPSPLPITPGSSTSSRRFPVTNRFNFSAALTEIDRAYFFVVAKKSRRFRRKQQQRHLQGFEFDGKAHNYIPENMVLLRRNNDHGGFGNNDHGGFGNNDHGAYGNHSGFGIKDHAGFGNNDHGGFGFNPNYSNNGINHNPNFFNNGINHNPKYRHEFSTNAAPFVVDRPLSKKIPYHDQGIGGGGGFNLPNPDIYPPRAEVYPRSAAAQYMTQSNEMVRTAMEREKERYLMSLKLNSNVYSDLNVLPRFNRYLAGGGSSEMTSDDGASTSASGTSANSCDICVAAKREGGGGGGAAAQFHCCKLDAVLTEVFRSPAGPIARPRSSKVRVGVTCVEDSDIPGEPAKHHGKGNGEGGVALVAHFECTE